jgi:hypothetical protein
VHNEAAVGHVLAALPTLGRRVPDDVSVVAICPDEVAERSGPTLTSVLIPAEEVGRQAVSLLMRKVAGDAVPGATLLDPRLTVRASTASVDTARIDAEAEVADPAQAHPAAAGAIQAGTAPAGAAHASTAVVDPAQAGDARVAAVPRPGVRKLRPAGTNAN